MKEEIFQWPDYQWFHKEHDRLIREFLNFKQQQGLNLASIQSIRVFRKVAEELQKQLSDEYIKGNSSGDITHIFDKAITNIIELLANINAYSYSIEALIEEIVDIKVPGYVELKFKKKILKN